MPLIVRARAPHHGQRGPLAGGASAVLGVVEVVGVEGQRVGAAAVGDARRRGHVERREARQRRGRHDAQRADVVGSGVAQPVRLVLGHGQLRDALGDDQVGVVAKGAGAVAAENGPQRLARAAAAVEVRGQVEAGSAGRVDDPAVALVAVLQQLRPRLLAALLLHVVEHVVDGREEAVARARPEVAVAAPQLAQQRVGVGVDDGRAAVALDADAAADLLVLVIVGVRLLDEPLARRPARPVARRVARHVGRHLAHLAAPVARAAARRRDADASGGSLSLSSQ